MTFLTLAFRQSELIKAIDGGLALGPSAVESLQISLRWPNYLINSVHDKTMHSLLLSVTLPTKLEWGGGDKVGGGGDLSCVKIIRLTMNIRTYVSL